MLWDNKKALVLMAVADRPIVGSAIYYDSHISFIIRGCMAPKISAICSDRALSVHDRN